MTGSIPSFLTTAPSAVDPTAVPQAVTPTTPLPVTVTIPAGTEVVADGAVTTAAPVYVNGTNRPLSLDTGGGLRTSTQGTVANSTSGNPNPIAIGMRSSTGGSVSTADQYGNSNNLSGSTILAAGLVAQLDDVSTATVTENNVGNLRMSSTRGLLGAGQFNTTLPTVANGATAELQMGSRGSLNVTLYGQNSTTPITTHAPGGSSGIAPGSINASDAATYASVFNGSGWDAQKGNLVEGTVIKPYAFAASDFTFTSATINAVNTVLKAAGGATIRNFITGLDWSSVATTVATVLQVLDGATVIWQTNIPAGAARDNVQFPTPLRSTANTALNVICTIAPVGALAVNAQGYQAAA